MIGCVLCEIKPITLGAVNLKLHKHHVEGHGVGEVILVCAYHHKNLHAFTDGRAVQICEKNNPNFYRDCLEEYKKLLPSKRWGFLEKADYGRGLKNDKA